MKTNLLVALASFGVLLAACSVKSTLTKTQITTNPGNLSTKIRIGVDASFPPFATTGTTKNKFTGFDIDLMKAIAARTGLDIEFTNVEINQLLTGVVRCNLDGGISAITISDQLKKQMEFSDPYFTVAQVIVVKKGNISINSREQLSGMVVGVQEGSPSVKEIQKIPRVQLNSYPSISLAFQLLITGNIDAVITSKPRALSYIATPANSLRIVGEEFGSESYGIAICKNKPDLVKKINEGLAAIKADGTLDKLSKKWIK